MTLEPMLRMIAGTFVAASVLLGMFVHPYFLWFTLFVGLNLFQSAFTDWCAMMTFLPGTDLPSQASVRRQQCAGGDPGSQPVLRSPGNI